MTGLDYLLGYGLYMAMQQPSSISLFKVHFHGEGGGYKRVYSVYTHEKADNFE